MPFVAPKTTATSNNAAGRTTFRPPWVKEDGQTGLKPTPKSTVPWAKKNADAKDAESPNQSILKKTNNTTNPSKTDAEPIAIVKKTTEPLKKTNEPVKKITAPVKKIPEPIKKAAAATNNASKSVAAKKKEPTPPSSSEEEESEEVEEEEEETDEETEEETEEESEEETEEESEDVSEKDDKMNSSKKPLPETNNKTKPTPTTTGKKIIPPKTQPPKKEEEESELKRRFSLEKPKLRPVVVKRDKSMKKIEDEEEAEEGETEEERERRLRFKLEKPKLRHVKREEKPLPSKSTENILKIRPVLKKVPKVDDILKEPKEEPKPEFKTKTLRKTPSIKRELSIKSVPAPPPLPSLVPKAPPPPPPPLGQRGAKKETSEARKQAIEKLKTRPRRRPDWSEMMKEVESGRKLRHVDCNDRSQPILTCKSMTKVDNKFIYETEKDNSHNKLLKQIQGGIKLKPTQTNDRSRPFINGLRKFRKQMTIEEQLQKSQSKINMLAAVAGGTDATDGVAPSASSTRAGSIVSGLLTDDPSSDELDELDDIDKIRDDLQSTKQMLALELRSREAQERENKKLLAKIATLEAELEREKSREKNFEYGSRIIVATMEATPKTEEAFVKNLKQEAEESKQTAQELEKKYLTTGEQLDQAKSEIEEQKRQIQILERKLTQALQGNGVDSRRASDVHNGRDSSPDFDMGESESDPDEPEEKKAERREKRLVKEVKVLLSKLTKSKVKEEAAKKEKIVLKEAMKKNHVILKEEKKKFKKLEKEVHKMAASMKEDVDEDENNEVDEEKEEHEELEKEDEGSEEESEEESEESESEESGNETASESEAEDAPTAAKKDNLEPRVKKHEGRLTAMKKCNVLLQANVDNLQDEISQVRYKASNLQSELDSVLADLGF